MTFLGMDKVFFFRKTSEFLNLGTMRILVQLLNLKNNLLRHAGASQKWTGNVLRSTKRQKLSKFHTMSLTKNVETDIQDSGVFVGFEHACAYVYACTCVLVYVYIYAYAHTHKHTHTQSRFSIDFDGRARIPLPSCPLRRTLAIVCGACLRLIQPPFPLTFPCLVP